MIIDPKKKKISLHAQNAYDVYIFMWKIMGPRDLQPTIFNLPKMTWLLTPT